MVPEPQQRTHNTQEAHSSSDCAVLNQMDRGNERDKHGQEVIWVIYKGSHQKAWLPLKLTHPGRVKTHTGKYPMWQEEVAPSKKCCSYSTKQPPCLCKKKPLMSKEDLHKSVQPKPEVCREAVSTGGEFPIMKNLSTWLVKLCFTLWKLKSIKWYYFINCSLSRSGCGILELQWVFFPVGSWSWTWAPFWGAQSSKLKLIHNSDNFTMSLLDSSAFYPEEQFSSSTRCDVSVCVCVLSQALHINMLTCRSKHHIMPWSSWKNRKWD